MKKLLLFLVFCSAAFFTPVFGQLDIKPGDQPPFTPENLVTNFMTGSGIKILNVTYKGGPAAVGYFSGGDPVIGLERGLVLTTGAAAGPPNSTIGAGGIGSEFASYSNNVHDTMPLLSAAAMGSLFDLACYTITFQSDNDSIRFRYVFASEEYPEFACTQFNDIFGFFLEGPGYATPVNLAMIPGTNLPVSINNIHGANAQIPGCNPAFEQYYNDNNLSAQQPSYDGVLDPFVATAAVEPCGIYTMTIAIADVGDGAYDSGVFLEANSFGSNSFVESSFGPGSNVLPEGTTGLPVSLNFSQIPANLLPLTVTFGGDAVRDADYTVSDSTFTINTTDSVLQFTIQPLADSVEEIIETVVVNVSGGDCFIKTFELYIADPGAIFKSAGSVFLTGTAILGGDMTSGENTISKFTNETAVPIDPANLTVVSQIQVQGVALEKLIDPAVIESVCLNIDHNWIGNVDVFLMAPGGKYMELTSGNGDSGNNYTGTCFSPAATDAIDFGLGYAPASAAPFTGTFKPEGKWTDLTGSDVNGTWNLVVSQNVAGVAGVLKDWSITFNTALAGNFQYAWSTGETEKTIEIDASGVYTVTVNNAVSSYSKQYVVKNFCGQSQQLFTLCSGESVVVNGVTYDENNTSGEQVFHIGPACDSVLTVQVQFLPESQQTIAASVCSGQGYAFGNEIVSVAGTYQQVLTSVNGCDSLITLHLTVFPEAETAIQATICQGEVYAFGEEMVSSAGTYQHILQTVNGCDSVVVLDLTVLPVLQSSLEATICSGAVYVFGNQSLTASGTYQQTLQSAGGCDSIVVLDLNVLPVSQSSLEATICSGAVYMFGNQSLTASGTYQQTLQSASGCDSVVVLDLNVLDVAISEFSAVTCAGVGYVFNGEVLFETGIYDHLLTSSAGCDSVAVLYLEVLPAASDSVFAVIQPGEVFEAGGLQFDQAGDYTVTLVAANGCDSILYIHVEVVSGVGGADISGSVSVSPNPAHGTVKIQWPVELNFERMIVRAADQRMMISQPVSAISGNTILDISRWQSGVYVVELTGPAGKVAQKMIKR